jgi:cytochrome c553
LCAERKDMNTHVFCIANSGRAAHAQRANERHGGLFCMRRTVLGLLLLVIPATAYPEPIEVKANVCDACHGIKGLPVEKTVPIIWGQNAGYLYLQLRDFQKGARKNAAMSVIAHDVVRDDALEFAQYFAAKPWPRTDAPLASPADAATSAALDKSVPCRTCHFRDFQGDSSVPRLAGQQHDYLVRTLMDFRNDTRANNPVMSDLMNSVTPEQIEAMASYLAGL